MKNIKKLKSYGKAVAGSALLVGATLTGAGLAVAQSGSSGASYTLDDYPQPFVDDDGNLDSTIVVGTDGKQADVVSAIDLAGDLGNEAFTTETVEGTAGAVDGEQLEKRIRYGMEPSIDASDYSGFIRKTVEDDEGNDVFVTESADFFVHSAVNETDVEVEFGTGAITYNAQYSPGFQVNDTITLLGEEYELTNIVDSNEVELGSSMDNEVTVGDNFEHGPYTVEVTGKTQGDNPNPVVRVSKGEETLDTAALSEGEELEVDDEDFVVRAETVIFYDDGTQDITLETTYTDTTLESGETLPMDDRYEVESLGFDSNVEKLQSIKVDNTVKSVDDPEDSDEVAHLETGESFQGPAEYFSVTNQGLTNEATGQIEFGEDYEVTYEDANNFEHSLDISKVTASGSAQLYSFADTTLFVDDGTNSGTYEDGDDVFTASRLRNGGSAATLAGKTAHDFATSTRYSDADTNGFGDSNEAIIRNTGTNADTLEPGDTVTEAGNIGLTQFGSDTKFVDGGVNDNNQYDGGTSGEAIIRSPGDSTFESSDTVVTPGSADFQSAEGTNLGYYDDPNGDAGSAFDSDGDEPIYDRGGDTNPVEVGDTRLDSVTVIAGSDASSGNIERGLSALTSISGTPVETNLADGDLTHKGSGTGTVDIIKYDYSGTTEPNWATSDDLYLDVDDDGQVSQGDFVLYQGDNSNDYAAGTRLTQTQAENVRAEGPGSKPELSGVTFNTDSNGNDLIFDVGNDNDAGSTDTTPPDIRVDVDANSLDRVTTSYTSTTDLSSATVVSRDTDGVSGDSASDLLFVDVNNAGGIDSGGTIADVRLNLWSQSLSSGPVSSTDLDQGVSLTSFTSGDNIDVMNKDGGHNSAYDSNEAIIASSESSGTATSDLQLDSGDQVEVAGSADIQSSWQDGNGNQLYFTDATDVTGATSGTYDDGEAIVADPGADQALSNPGIDLTSTNGEYVVTEGKASLTQIPSVGTADTDSGYIFIEDGTTASQFDYGDDILSVTRQVGSSVALDGKTLNNFASDIKHTASGTYSGGAIVRDVDGNGVFSSSTDVTITGTVTGGNGAGIVENGQGDKEVYTDINGYPLKVEFDDSSDEATLSYQEFEETIKVGDSDSWTTGYGFTVDADFTSDVGANAGEDLVLSNTDSELNTEYGAKIRWTGSSTVVEEENGETATVSYTSSGGDEVLDQITFSNSGNTAAPDLTDTEDGESTLTEWGSAVELDSDSSATVTYPDEQRMQLTAFGSVGEGTSSGDIQIPAGFPSGTAELDTEASTDDNLVLVGGPLVNDLTADLADQGDTWNASQYEDNQDVGVLDLVNDAFDDSTALVVAGWNAEGTDAAADFLADYTEEDTGLEGLTTAKVDTESGTLAE